MSRWRRRVAAGIIGVAGGAALALACTDLSGLSNPTETPPEASVGIDASSDAASGIGPGDAAACGANLTNDPKNCGRCGRDCLGARCTAGACEPATVADLLQDPNGLAVGPSEIYVSSWGDATVWSFAKNGGKRAALATGQTSVRGVALSGTTLVWANADGTYDDAGTTVGGVWRCEVPACADKQLVVAINGAEGPLVAGDTVYFGAQNYVYRAPLTGAAPTLLAFNGGFSLALDQRWLYFVGPGNLGRVELDGGAVEQLLFAQDTAGFVALDDTHVYWAFGNPSGGHVVALGKATPGVNSTTYGTAADSENPIGVGVDETYVYWSTGGASSGAIPIGDGKLLACPKKGCGSGGPIVLATGNYGGGPLVVEAKEIYWVEIGSTKSNGRVRKVAKP